MALLRYFPLILQNNAFGFVDTYVTYLGERTRLLSRFRFRFRVGVKDWPVAVRLFISLRDICVGYLRHQPELATRLREPALAGCQAVSSPGMMPASMLELRFRTWPSWLDDERDTV